MGAGAITYSDIADYMRVTGHILKGWEVDAIKRIDGVWLKVQAENRKSSS